MKTQIIKEGNVVLPKDYKIMTMKEYYFVVDYLKVIHADFAEIMPKKSYRSKTKRLVIKSKSK